MKRIACFILLLSLSTLCWGDVLILKNGKRLEGKVTQSQGKYFLETSSMKASFSAQEVEKVIYQKDSSSSLEAEFLQQWKQFLPGDYSSRYALAQQCEKKKLPELARKIYEEILTIQPDHYPTRAALGYVRYKGEWMKKEEFLKKIQYASHKGNWIPKEEKERIEREEREKKQIGEIKNKIRKVLILGALSEQKKLKETLEKEYSIPLLLSASRGMLEDGSLSVQKFSLQYIGEKQDTLALEALTKKMLYDPVPSIRSQSYHLVKALGGPNPLGVGTILGALDSHSVSARFAALGAVNGFKLKEALPILYSRMDGLSGDLYLPRQHAFFGTYRAYIKGWQLGSAGNQQQATEVPDPEIDTFFEGTVVETQLVQIEYQVVVTTIERIRRR